MNETRRHAAAPLAYTALRARPKTKRALDANASKQTRFAGRHASPFRPEQNLRTRTCFTYLAIVVAPVSPLGRFGRVPTQSDPPSTGGQVFGGRLPVMWPPFPKGEGERSESDIWRSVRLCPWGPPGGLPAALRRCPYKNSRCSDTHSCPDLTQPPGRSHI